MSTAKMFSAHHLQCLVLLGGWMIGCAGQVAADEYQLLGVLRPSLKEADQHPPVVTAIAFHPHGRWLATAGDDHVIRLWDIQQQRAVAVLHGHKDWVKGVGFSGNGQTLASVGADGKLFLWDLKERRRSQTLASDYPLSALALMPDGQRFVVGGLARAIYTMDGSRKATSLMKTTCGDLYAIAVSPDGRRLAGGGRDGNAYLWSTATGQLIRKIPAHHGRMRAIAFSNDGKQLVTGGEDRAVCVWDVDTGKEIVRLDTKGAKVFALCVLPGDLLASAGSDNTIRIWHLRLRTEVQRIEGHTGSIAVLATDGRRLASGGFDTTVRLWALPERADLETASKQEMPRER
jgi:WD40 repeat protein